MSRPDRSVEMTRSVLVGRLREAASHTVIYGLGSIAQRVLGFVLIPLYTRYYSAETYGVLNLVMLAGTMAGTIFYLGASSALSRSYFDYAASQRKVVVSTSFYISVTGAILQVIIGTAAAPLLSRLLFSTAAYAPHIRLAFAGSALTFLNALFYVVLRFERKSIRVVTLSLFSLVSTTGLVLTFLVYAQLDVLAPLLGTFVSELIMFAFLLISNRHLIRPIISLPELDIQLRFGLSQVAVGLAYYILDSADRLMVGKYASLSDVGVYSLGYRIGMAIQLLFILPFAQIWAPMRMEYRADAVAKDLSRLILTYYFVIGGIATVSISIFARQVVTLLAGRPEYFDAFRVVPLVMLGHLCYGAVNIVDAGIYFQRKILYYLYIFAAAVMVNVTLNYLLIPQFGYMAAAWTKALSYFLLAVTVHLVSRRFYPLLVDSRRLLMIGVSVCAVLLAGNVFNPDSLTVAIGVKVGLLAALVGGWVRCLLTDREREGLQAMIPKLWYAKG